MFSDTCLRGENGTEYDEDNDYKTYARIDKKGEPGYFTDKKSVKSTKDIILKNSIGEINIGDSNYFTIDYDINPKDATDRNIYFELSDSGIASMDGRNIVGISEGTVEVTMTLKNGTADTSDDIVKKCTVKVKIADTENASFDRKTGTLTLKGEISKEWLDLYSRCTTIKHIVAAEGAVLPEECDELFFGGYNYTEHFWTELETIDLSKADSSAVTSTFQMFSGCKKLRSVDLSGFDTSRTDQMTEMFERCVSLEELDLSSFDTSNVCVASEMFSGCSSLKTIYVSEKWTIKNMSDTDGMFSGCLSLIGGNGTTFDIDDAEYARIDKKDEPGYLN